MPKVEGVDTEINHLADGGVRFDDECGFGPSDRRDAGADWVKSVEV